MKVILIGLGSIAKRHIRNIKQLYPDFQVAVLRQQSKDVNAGELNSCIDTFFLNEQEALQWNPDAAFITNPSPFHIEIAMSLAMQDCHLFMEKPFSHSLDGIDELILECKERNLTLMIGYCLRFLKPLQVVKEHVEQGTIGDVLCVRASVGGYLPTWRPQNDYRKNVSAQKNLGGGVLLELSHELDLVQWLVGEIVEVNAYAEKTSALEIDVEDVAEVNVRFKNKAIGNVHLDMIDQGANRSCRVIGSEGTLFWEKSSVRLFQKGMENCELIWEEDLDWNQMYLDEIAHFFQCVQSSETPLIDGICAKKTMEIILAAKQSAEKGEIVKL